jgi:hypothetical protein
MGDRLHVQLQIKMIKYIFVFVCILAVSSCKKAEDRSCWKTVGENASKEILLEPFDKIKLHAHINYLLVQDSTDKLVLKGGKNLLNFVTAEKNDDVLEVKNENKCNFLRNYDKNITVEIHFTSLINIHFEGSEPLLSKGKLKFDWLTLLIRDGAGPVELDFEAQYINTILAHGFGSFKYTGSTNRANFNIRSNGYGDAFGLSVNDSLTVVSKTQGDVRVNANGAKLKAQTEADGDILYKGLPSSIQFNQYGTGKLVDAN